AAAPYATSSSNSATNTGRVAGNHGRDWQTDDRRAHRVRPEPDRKTCSQETWRRTMKDRSHSVARLFGVAILLAAWVATGLAQTQGGVPGRVRDSSGASIPGANVTVTNTATSGTRNTVT